MLIVEVAIRLRSVVKFKAVELLKKKIIKVYLCQLLETSSAIRAVNSRYIIKYMF